MQLQALMLMLFMLIIIPTMILISDHNVFFVIISIALLVLSFRNIHYILFNIYQQAPDDNDEHLDEHLNDLENALNIDIRKFGTGAAVARDLIAILFLTYCSHYLHIFWFKLIIVFCNTYWAYDIVDSLRGNKFTNILKLRSRTKSLYLLLINVGVIVIILFTACNKFISSLV